MKILHFCYFFTKKNAGIFGNGKAFFDFFSNKGAEFRIPIQNVLVLVAVAGKNVGDQRLCLGDEKGILVGCPGGFGKAGSEKALAVFPAKALVEDVYKRQVKNGQTVCILEAMKLMNEIQSDFDCEIEAVLVSNEQKVEYGMPLFRVKKL